MVWDYAELNPFSSGGWTQMLDWVELVVDHCSQTSGETASVAEMSATSLPYSDNFFDAVFTDPPYYDNVAYPELFSTMLTPKSDEIIQDPGRHKDKQFFEERLTRSLKEIYRVLRPEGIVVIVYAHKSTDGWETIINSILNSGLVVTAAWPIHTEMRERLVAKETAALASSIYMVARKAPRKPVGFYKDVRDSLRSHMTRKLDLLWKDGIAGGDFFISGIGSSIEVFGRYEKIVDDEGNVVRADGLLKEVRKIVTDYAIKQVLHDEISGQLTPLTSFYILWRWAYGEAKLEFDDAHKLAQGVGIMLDREWNKGFIHKDKEFIEALGPEKRELEGLEDSNDLIDTLHRTLILWKRGRGEEVLQVLKDTGFGKNDVFYKVAQAIAESLPTGSKEKKLLEGFLQSKQRISEDLRTQSEQKTLFE
jgi:adenine-specific DNA methylase